MLEEQDLLNASGAGVRPSLRAGVSPTGREARETVHIINKEEQGFSFAFQDNSRYSEGFSNSLVICPMEGWIPPLSR